MPYIVAHPGTLITYRTKREAVAAAKSCVDEHKKDTEILNVKFVEKWEPPEDDDPDGGEEKRKTG